MTGREKMLQRLHAVETLLTMWPIEDELVKLWLEVERSRIIEGLEHQESQAEH